LRWGNRKPIAIILTVVFVVLSGTFLSAGIWYNPSFQTLFSKPPEQKTIIGPGQQFDLPSNILPPATSEIIGNTTSQTLAYYGYVTCNVTSVNLAVGNKVFVRVTVGVPQVVLDKYRVYLINVFPEDALMYQESEQGLTFAPMASEILLGFYSSNKTTDGGSQMVIFQTPEKLSLTIKMYYEYPQGSSISNTYTAKVTFPNIFIDSGLGTQQQANENQNLSLSFFVLFFACVDIAVVFYDHSEKKNNSNDFE
jgi:hypothetical protein